VLRIKKDNEVGGGGGEEKRRFCLELGIDICLNFQNFLLGFASLGFATSTSLSLSLWAR
jgi:NADPH-dependent curcumin reductase CurA